MSPSHRPRLPRRPIEDASPKTAPAEEPSVAGEHRADELAAPTETVRRRLAEAARRNDEDAERDPETARRDELRRLRKERERPRTGRPAVRVNHPEKVRPEPIVPAADSAEKTLVEDSATDPEGGSADREDPASPAAAPDNVVSFESRRRGREESASSGRRRRRGRGAGVTRAAERSFGGRRTRLRRWGLGLLAFVLAAAVFFGVVFWSPLLAARTIEVQGTRLSDQQSIERSLEPLRGRSLTRITQDDVKRAIGQNIVIRDVTIEDRPPHDLVVTVHERVPVATVQEGGKYVLVDRDGVAIGSVDSADQAKVPLVDGGLAAVKSSAFTDLVGALQAMPQSLLEQLESAQAKSETDLELVMKDGSTVRWGTSDRNEYKAEVLQALVKAAGQSGGASVYDVSSPDHPVTRSS